MGWPFKLFSKQPDKTTQEIYSSIVSQSRHPYFYKEIGVADTPLMRFEMIALHAFLFFDRLSGDNEKAQKCAQEVYDLMWLDIDSAIRELGIGDVAVPKRIKAMTARFYKRSALYKQALEKNDAQCLNKALQEAFAENEENRNRDRLGSYVMLTYQSLKNQKTSDLIKNMIKWEDPENLYDTKKEGV